MNTTTNTAKQIAKAHGFKGILPESFPMPEEMASLPAGLASLAKKILDAGPGGLETRARVALWQNAEESFLAVNGYDWRSKPEATTQNQPEKASQQAEELPVQTLAGDELARFRYMASRPKAQDGNVYYLSRDHYNACHSAACAFRRAGGTAQTWARNFKLNAQDRDRYGWAIARIACIVWTMPIEELDAGKPVF